MPYKQPEFLEGALHTLAAAPKNYGSFLQSCSSVQHQCLSTSLALTVVVTCPSQSSNDKTKYRWGLRVKRASIHARSPLPPPPV